MVRVVEQPVHETTLVDIILGSIGVVGLILLAAVILGGVLGGALILSKRLRSRDGLDPTGEAQSLRVTPTS